VKEIQVLSDVRLSPDSVELILTHQTMAVEGGELYPVGDATESRVPLLVRRARITFGASADNLAGFVAVAHVQNICLIPFEVTKVALAYRNAEPQKVKIGGRDTEEIGGSYHFIPKDRKQVGPLLPLETKEYYLPAHIADSVLELMHNLPAQNVKVVAYADKDIVGEAPAREALQVFDFARQSRPGSVRLASAAKYMLAGLDVESSERIQSALRDLAMTAPDQRKAYPSLTKVDDELDLLSLPPDFRVLLRLYPQGGLEVVDVIRAAGRKAESPEEDHVDAKA